MKKRILLIADVSWWIFDRHCNEIKKRLTEYDFVIQYQKNIYSFSYEYFNNFDLIYVLDAPITLPYYNKLKHKTVLGIRAEFYYPHTPEAIKKYYTTSIKPRSSAFHVVNMRQYNEFKKIADIPLHYAPHGVDTEVFNSTPNFRDELVVGINGSTQSGGHKGFDIVKKACDTLNIKYVSSLQDTNGRHLTKQQMPEFYKKIDIYCNMSVSEGCNNSIMEAGAMGKMVIATPVGAAPEIIEDYRTGLLCNRSVKNLVERLEECKNNKDIVKTCGQNLYNKIHSEWCWDKKIDGYRELFKEVL
jgi:glycosyltransferase involved in cell wall biosynthesis